MPPLRALCTLAPLWPLTLCACASTVPWPPKAGSCIEVYKPPGRRTLPRYWINGNRASAEKVASTVYDTPERRAKARRFEAVGTTLPILMGSGLAGAQAGMVTAAATSRPLYSLISVGGVVAMVTGAILLTTVEDPFQGAVVAFNEKARRTGFCSAAPRPLPAPPPYEVPAELPVEIRPAPRPPEGLPELPQKGWEP